MVLAAKQERICGETHPYEILRGAGGREAALPLKKFAHQGRIKRRWGGPLFHERAAHQAAFPAGFHAGGK
jgi:hypothetical protein